MTCDTCDEVSVCHTCAVTEPSVWRWFVLASPHAVPAYRCIRCDGLVQGSGSMLWTQRRMEQHECPGEVA